MGIYSEHDRPRCQIVILTDNEEASKIIGKLVSKGSYEVAFVYENDDGALQNILDVQPDLLIADLYFAQKGMIELIEQAHYLLPIPVLFLGGNDFPNVFPDVKSIENSSFMLRPISFAGLKLSIELLLYKQKIHGRAKEHERWLSTTLNSMVEGVIVTDKEGSVTYMNPTAELLTGWKLSQAEGIYISRVFNAVYEETGAKVFSAEKDIVYDSEQTHTDACLLLNKKNERFPIQKTITPLKNDRGDDEGVVVVFRDVTHSKRMEEQLKSMAITDELTLLHNRVGFVQASTKQLQFARSEERKLLVLFVDLNKLKQINDTYGHKEGDKALQATAAILQRSFRSTDIIGRIGGDEFVVLARLNPSDSDLIMIERVQEQIDAFNESSDLTYPISLSIGSAIFEPGSPVEIEDLLNKADHMMYQNKLRRKAITDRNIQTTQLMILLDSATTINSSMNIKDIKEKTIEAAMLLVNAEASSLILIDAETEEMFFDVALGNKGDSVKTIRMPKGHGIAGWVAQNKQPVLLNDPKLDERFFYKVDQQTSFETRNMICMPIMTKSKLLGVLEVINKQEGVFTNYDQEMLTALANQIAIAIDNAHLYEELRDTFYSFMDTLASTIDKRDPYTGGHTRRVKDYSLAIGKALNLSEDDLSRLELAAILHDIGKIGVSDSILRKTTKLTPDEYQEMKNHPVYGEEILRPIQNLQGVIPGIKHHHERHDGRGYPDGLKGDEIDITARIISVADAYDAMVTTRSYRNKMDNDFATDELRKNAGEQFDPVIVEVFLKILENY